MRLDKAALAVPALRGTKIVRRHNGELTVVGSTHDFAGAEERFKRLADDMKETVAAYFGPAMLVKVYRVTPAGQREDAF